MDAVEEQQKGRLAGAVAPEHRDAFPVVDGEVDVEERGGPVGVREADTRHDDRRSRHRSTHARLVTVQVAARIAAAAVHHPLVTAVSSPAGIDPV